MAEMGREPECVQRDHLPGLSHIAGATERWRAPCSRAISWAVAGKDQDLRFSPSPPLQPSDTERERERETGRERERNRSTEKEARRRERERGTGKESESEIRGKKEKPTEKDIDKWIDKERQK